jgi:hypothetical protein
MYYYYYYYNVGTQPHRVKEWQYNYTFALRSYCMGRQSKKMANALLLFSTCGQNTQISTNYLVLSGCKYILEQQTLFPTILKP